MAASFPSRRRKRVTSLAGQEPIEAGHAEQRHSPRLSRIPTAASIRVPIAVKFTAFLAMLVVAFMTWQTYTAIRIAHSRLDKQVNKNGIGLATALASLIEPQWVIERSQNELVSALQGFTQSPGAELVQVLNVVVFDAVGEPIATARGESTFSMSRAIAVASTDASRAEVDIHEFEYAEQPVRSFSRRILPLLARDTVQDSPGEGVGRLELYISAKEIDDSREELTQAMVTVSMTAFLVAAVSCFLLASFLTRHIRALLKDIRQVSHGDLHHQSGVHSSDELGDLARAFNVMTNSLQAAQESKLAQRALDQELSIATKIQTGLLPSSAPELDGFDLASYYLSAKEVGGDYYDFLPVDDNHVGMVVADVSGKSVPGSLIMTMTRSLLRLAAERELSPARTVQIVNRFLTPDVSPGMFVTLAYFVLNVKTREVRLVRCGHNAPLLYSARHRKLVRVQPQGIALCLDREGSLFQSELKVQRFVLSSGDILFCYTDGVTEAKNRSGRDYTEERLSQIVAANARRTAGEIVQAVVKDVSAHQRGAQQSDDITMLVVKSC